METGEREGRHQSLWCRVRTTEHRMNTEPPAMGTRKRVLGQEANEWQLQGHRCGLHILNGLLWEAVSSPLLEVSKKRVEDHTVDTPRKRFKGIGKRQWPKTFRHKVSRRDIPKRREGGD